jgi:predicted lipoprotein
MTKTLRTSALLVLVTGIALTACSVRETRVIQPAAAPAGTTVVVPDRDPDVIVDVD